MNLYENIAEKKYDNKIPYTKETRHAYREEENRIYELFNKDCIAYAIANGVPEQYASKVFSKAWQDGHAYGYSEIVIHLEGLIEIFN
jgi:hypothetical protein